MSDVTNAGQSAPQPAAIPAGYVLVPIEPTVSMVVNGFESWPDPIFSTPEEWGAFEKMTGCQQATHKARLCYSAMLAAAPPPPAPASAVSVDECAHDVYERGQSIGLFDIPKETANAICSGISTVMGARVDWHYIGGRVHMKALVAPASAPAPVGLTDGWQPIETAPKDGTEVVLLFDDEVALLGKMRPRVRAASWLVDWTIPYLRDNPPTHWMPLPVAPFNDARAGEGR